MFIISKLNGFGNGASSDAIKVECPHEKELDIGVGLVVDGEDHVLSGHKANMLLFQVHRNES